LRLNRELEQMLAKDEERRQRRAEKQRRRREQAKPLDWIERGYDRDRLARVSRRLPRERERDRDRPSREAERQPSLETEADC